MGKNSRRFRAKNIWRKTDPEDDNNIVTLTDPKETDIIIPCVSPLQESTDTYPIC